MRTASVLAISFALLVGASRAQQPTAARCPDSTSAVGRRADSLVVDAYYVLEGGEHVTRARAVAMLRRAATAGPLTEQGWIQLRQLLRVVNAADSSVAVAQAAVERWPACVLGYYMLANWTAISGYSPARQRISQMLARFPNDAFALAGAGALCARMGYPEAALGFFKRALAIDSSIIARDSSLRALYDDAARRNQSVPPVPRHSP
jgi:tetratricopeptide (TPR) repeat protein